MVFTQASPIYFTSEHSKTTISKKLVETILQSSSVTLRHALKYTRVSDTVALYLGLNAPF